MRSERSVLVAHYYLSWDCIEKRQGSMSALMANWPLPLRKADADALLFVGLGTFAQFAVEVFLAGARGRKNHRAIRSALRLLLCFSYEQAST
jgi:hypothetical protein